MHTKEITSSQRGQLPNFKHKSIYLSSILDWHLSQSSIEESKGKSKSFKPAVRVANYFMLH